MLGGGIALIGTIAVAAALPGHRSPFFHQVLVTPLAATGMAAIVLGAALAPRGHRQLLEGRWLARAGKIAYPWYLTHVLVMWWAWGDLRAAFPGIVALAPIAQFALFLPVYLAASILFALLVHFAVEKPFLILKDRVGVRGTTAVRTSTLPVA